jgi:alkaline phosphatase D
MSRRSFLALCAAVAGACSSSGNDAAPVTSDATPATTTGGGASTTVPTTTVVAPPTTVQTATTQPPGGPPTAEYEGASNPFVLGVASGDPLADSVVLWTRLVVADSDGSALTGERSVLAVIEPEDAVAGGTGGGTAQAVWWRTGPDAGYSVHAVIDGLEADRWYTYRFESGGFTSATGRTRTAPAASATVEQFVVGTASCQNYEDGFYAAHDDIAAAGLDLLVWLGDYIYEGGRGVLGAEGTVRLHDGPEPSTLDEYRARYALYKSDRSLQVAHAACPWLMTWDDHEVDNNYAGTIGQDGEDLTARRALAYQAWWEHTPTRLPAPAGGDYVIYRPQGWGTLVDMSLLDTRQYRSNQACNDVTLSLDPPCPETFLPERTLLGAEQEAWLLDRFGAQGAVWNVLAQQVILSNSNLNGAILNFDQWDGYPLDRDRLLQHVVDAGIGNVVVLTGDIHFAGVGNIVAPGGALDSPVIATEFVATSISSSGNVPEALIDVVKSVPSIVDVELGHRGWTKHTVTPASWVAELRIVNDVADAASPSSTYRRFVVDAGVPGARPLDA